MRIDNFSHFGGSQRGGDSQPQSDDPRSRRVLTGRPSLTPTAPTGALIGDVEPELQHGPGFAALRVPALLGVVTLSAPVLVVALVSLGLPHDTSFVVMTIWSLSQFMLVVWLARRLLPAWVDGRAANASVVRGEVEDPLETAAYQPRDRLHEVRTTVAGIGLTHRLLSNQEAHLSAADRTRLEDLYDREITRLERLLRDEGPSAEETVDVGSVVDPIVESLRVRGHRVAWEGTEASAVGRGDDIAEIVHILLENAARHAPGADVSVRVESSPTQFFLHVSDNGPGVPRELVPRLFDRGVRGPESPGEGIGLDIARRLARRMGGDVFLDLAADRRGARFTVVLRACAKTAPCLTARR